MKKTDIKNAILENNGGSPFVSVAEYAHMMRIGKDKARAELTGIEYIERGKRKDFLVEDVVEAIYARRHKM